MDLKKGVIIGGVAVAVVLGLFIKNKIQEIKFQPLEKDLVLKILKKVRKENYALYKQIAMIANQIGNQYKSLDPEMIKAYINGPQSPLQAEKQMEENLQKVCKELQVNPSDFSNSVEEFIKKEDRDIIFWVTEGDRDFEQSLNGRLPQIKVTVPDFLTKNRILQIHRKLVLKRYLVQVNIYRKIKGKNQEQLMMDPEFMKEMPNPEQQQINVLEEEGLSGIDDPPIAVFEAALMKYKNDPQLKMEIARLEREYEAIFNKYRQKMQTKRITDEELGDLEDELIYSNSL